MKYIVCSVFNKDTKEYSAPLLYRTRKIAIADFKSKVEEMSGKKHFDPTDLVLFFIGNFNSDSGSIESCEKIKFCDFSDDDFVADDDKNIEEVN